MSNRNTFLINVGSTLAFAWFAIIGAFYIEMLKDSESRSSYALTLDLIGIVGIGYIVLQCYFVVLKSIEEEEYGD